MESHRAEVIVVLGNLVMYTTCAEAAKRIGYLLKDSEDGVYMATRRRPPKKIRRTTEA